MQQPQQPPQTQMLMSWRSHLKYLINEADPGV